MPEPAWKRFERRIARSLGVERTPLSGGASRHTASDTLHPQLFVECKHSKQVSVWGLWWLTQLRARAEGKAPVLALGRPRMHGAVAVLDWDYFLELYTLAEFARGYHERTRRQG